MKKIKMFSSTSIRDLEVEINQWLEEHQSLHMCKFLQTSTNGYIYVSIVYKVGI